jgi:hypothetical protein
VSPQRNRAVAAAVVAVVAALAFAPALRGGFLLDDTYLILGDDAVHSFAHAGRWLTGDFFAALDIAHLHYWRPLVTATYAVDWQLGGGAPLAFHLTNLLLAGLAAALACATLRRWTGCLIPAALATLVWALHPTRAENVAWISGRTDLLCLIFILVACAGLARRSLALQIAGTLGAYLSKETAIVLPLFAAIEAWVADGRPAIDRAVLRRLARAAAPQTAIAVAYLVAHAILLPLRGPSTIGLADHALIVLETFGRFVALTFAPHALSIRHGIEPGHSLAYVLAGAGALAALTALAVLARRRFPAATAGLALYVLAFAPTSNLALTQQQTLIADRFLYIPTFGLALVLASALAAVRRRDAYLVTTALAVALAALSLSRAADFGDPRQFWEREARLHPADPNALTFVLEAEITEHTLARLDEAARTAPDRATFAATAAEIIASTVPDREAPTLRDIDAFCAAVLAGRRAELAAWGVTVEPVDATAVRARLAAVRAEVARRIAHPRTGGDARAQLAAGNFEAAIRMLARTVPAGDIRPTIERWAAALDWLPTSAGGPSSP